MESRNIESEIARLEEEIARAEEAASVSTAENGIIKPAGPRKRAKAVRVEDIQVKEVEWLVPGYIPRGQITVLAGEGGVGKTTVECAIAAAVTTGKSCFLAPVPFVNEPENVVFLSGEDSFEYVLKKRLMTAGADLSRVFTVDIADDIFKEVKFGSAQIDDLIAEVSPGLMIFDPVQAFVAPDIHMGERNAMRQTLQPLIAIGKKHGVTFVIAVHTNKQNGAYGRKRIADSADLWDISRSVLIMGEADADGLRYISHEKSNLAPRSDTVLFELKDGIVVPRGTSTLRDAYYVGATNLARTAGAPKKEDAKQAIISALEAAGGRMEAKALAEGIIAGGIKKDTFERARKELLDEVKIEFRRAGPGGAGTYVLL